MRALTAAALCAACSGTVDTGTSATPQHRPVPGLKVDPSVSAYLLADGLGTVDDVAVGPDGTVYFSDEEGGHVAAFSRETGKVRVLAGGLAFPEGVAVVGDAVVVSEQHKNQLTRVAIADGATSVFRALVNTTNKAGVDGLAIDPYQPSLVVPDSPNGTLLRVSLDGATATPIPVTSAKQPPFTRPSGAFVTPDGILVTDEDIGRVFLRRPDGTLATVLPTVSEPDDVVADATGAVYVNAVGYSDADGALHRVRGGTDTVIVGGLGKPHGLAVDVDGNLIVSDRNGGGRLVAVVIH